MGPSVRWTAMDSPVKPANDAEASERGETEPCHVPTPPASPSGLTGGSMARPARWVEMDSPVEPANDAGECGAGVASHLHPTAVTLRLDRRVHGAARALDGDGFAGRAGE